MAVTSSNNLKKGMKDTNGSTDILELQKALNAAGNYNLALDGSFGNKTLAAVKDYQQKNGLKVDGIVGTNTWGALTKASSNVSNTASTAPTAPSVQTSEATNLAYNKLQDLETQKPGAFTYETPQSSWQNHIQETLDKILNKEPFSYDLNGDALYQQYKDQYTTQGQMAMIDTMGQAAAATGGYGNSYAQSVGQQTYQGYLQQLNNKVPELYQLALNQYNQEKQDLKDLYALFTDMDEREYNRAWDKINMDYSLHGDESDDWWKQYESANSDYWTKFGYDYQLGRDAITDKNSAYDRAMDFLAIGIMPDSALLTTAGISSSDAQALVKKVNQQSSASGSGGSGGNDGKIVNVSNNTGVVDNGGFDEEMVKLAQKFVGVDADGKWGKNSAAKAKAKGYNSIKEAVVAFYATFNAGDWEGYFAQIRQSEGKSAAEEELKYFTSNGLIPNKYVTYGAIGARGGSMGH